MLGLLPFLGRLMYRQRFHASLTTYPTHSLIMQHVIHSVATNLLVHMRLFVVRLLLLMEGSVELTSQLAILALDGLEPLDGLLADLELQRRGSGARDAQSQHSLQVMAGSIWCTDAACSHEANRLVGESHHSSSRPDQANNILPHKVRREGDLRVCQSAAAVQANSQALSLGPAWPADENLA